MQVMYLFRSLSTTVQTANVESPLLNTRLLPRELCSQRLFHLGNGKEVAFTPAPLRFNIMDTGIVCHLCTRFNNLLFALAFSRYARKASEIVGNIFIDTIPTFCRRSAYFTISNLCQLS